ncbi:hypothetical protein TWF718_005281 [Orbilia javanica]|uniref:BTB domain-containing protein n=1 Tax=Orbilia javanica TaxID=47235 RepID=A0AAN8RDG4_9PEZI
MNDEEIRVLFSGFGFHSLDQLVDAGQSLYDGNTDYDYEYGYGYVYDDDYDSGRITDFESNTHESNDDNESGYKSQSEDEDDDTSYESRGCSGVYTPLTPSSPTTLVSLPSSPSLSSSSSSSSIGEAYIVSQTPDTCLLVTCHGRPRAQIWVHQYSITTTSPIFRAYFNDPNIVTKVQTGPTGQPRYVIPIVWQHVDALLLLLKILNHVPTAFPSPSDLPFATFWQVCLTLQHFEINLVPWFEDYYRYWRGRKMEDGFEQWLVVGKVFEDKEGYARLVARVILEFKGWEGQEWDNKVTLVGPEGRKGPDGEELKVYERWGPSCVFEHMKTEQSRLRASITRLLNSWYTYNVHLKTRKKLICTCSPVEDCILAAKELTSMLKHHKLITYKHHAPSYDGSLLELRLLFQSLEVRPTRGVLGGMAFGNCKVYDSIMKLIRDIDGVLEGVRGVDYNGEGEEVFGIREICRKEMVLPWSMGQVGVGVMCAGLVGTGVGMVAWAGFKMFLRGVGRLEKMIE